MRELAGNPLLLTMMALLNRTSSLSDRRAELYSRCVALLVHQWEAEVHRLPSGPTFGPYSKDSRQLSLDEKCALLRAVASHMQTVEGALAFNLIDSESLQQALVSGLPAWVETCDRERVAKDLVEQLQGRNYILASLGGARFGFVHRTFLEYCCADYYLFLLKEEGTLSEKEFFSKTFGLHWEEPAWAEILLLLASQLAPSRLRNVLERALELKSLSGKNAVCFAAKLLGESSSHEGLELVSTKIWDSLNEIVNAPFTSSAIDKPTFKKMRESWANAINAIRVGWFSTNKSKDWLIHTVKTHQIDIVRFHCMAELVHWPEDPLVRLLYESLLLNDSMDLVRLGSIIFLVVGWPHDQAMRSLFMSCTKPNDDGIVRPRILNFLASFWPQDIEVQRMILRSATEDSNEHSRIEALQGCGNVLSDRKKLASLLRDRAQNDPSPLVRGAATEEFSKHFPK